MDVTSPRVLIAGIGNVFFGDDGFGVEVVRQLLERTWPEGVYVRDFGIRGIDFAYALLDGYDLAIVVDAMSRGREPGTLYVVEPEDAAPDARHLHVDTHGMAPGRVLQFVRAMTSRPVRLRIVGCEPRRLDEFDAECQGLSDDVRAALGPAVAIIEGIVREVTGSGSVNSAGLESRRA